MTVSLKYTDTGGQGEPLIIVHGLLGSADNWRSHVKQWSSERRVIALDLRNHGRSPHAEGMEYSQMAEDVAGRDGASVASSEDTCWAIPWAVKWS